MPGGNVFVPARMHTRLHTHHDACDDTQLLGDAFDLADFVEGIDEDSFDTFFVARQQRKFDFAIKLVVPVQSHFGGVCAGAQRHCHLAKGSRVDSHPGIRDDANYVGRKECLAGVESVATIHSVAVPEFFGHRGRPDIRASSKISAIEDKRGRGKVIGKIRQRNSTDF